VAGYFDLHSFASLPKESRPAEPILVDMPSRTTAEADRRRSPRFACGGHVHINCLPSDGIILPGQVRDLSLGGCHIDTLLPIACGARAEIVVRVNAASFRALGEVKAVRGTSGAGLEFVQLSTGGKDMLSDLITDLARLQSVMNRLKSSRRDSGADSLREQLSRGKLQALLNGQFQALGPTLLAGGGDGRGDESQRPDQVIQSGNSAPGNVRIVNAEPLVLTIDIFG
jgi:hypothetical protein